MSRLSNIKVLLATTACAAALATTAAAAPDFNIPGGDLEAALNAYSKQAGIRLMYSDEAVKGIHTRGVSGAVSPEDALTKLLSGTGFVMEHRSTGAITIVRDQRAEAGIAIEDTFRLAQATAPARASVETVTVTSSKLGGADVQSIPIAITAMSQEQLTSTQTAGGPDLVKQVPNLTFTKTNFTGYSIQIRGIGTQAISVSTDPAVAVAFNDIPFIRNHFFEQEFFDVAQVEVARGPQGTLYGRNATAGVVNVISAKPTDQYEAMASVDVGNYNNRRLEGMLNIPLIGDKLGLRIAGEWTKRDGYTFNETTNKSVDGRDLWSGRVTVGVKPLERLQVNLVWEHFSESDDRLRSAKQLCKKDPGPDFVDGFDVNDAPTTGGGVSGSAYVHAYLSQGCLPTSLYSPEAFETPNGQAIPFVFAGAFAFKNGVAPGGPTSSFLLNQIDPYLSTVQSRNLRVIQSELAPIYHAKNDTLELNADFDLTPTLKLTSQTGYNSDQLRSTEDFNRFNTAPGLFADITGGVDDVGRYFPPLAPTGTYCDPQLGCSSKMVGEDLSREHAWQFNQEVRLESKLDGPFNFSVGANFMHYETVEDYFIFFNLITLETQLANHSSDYTSCFDGDPSNPSTHVVDPIPATPFTYAGFAWSAANGCPDFAGFSGTYIDPNPIGALDGNGHNYFRSKNPYLLNSYAGFGEAYYQVSPEVKLTGGLRWTDDKKTFWNIPSWTYLEGGGYPAQSVIAQEWREWTGRFNVNWTPKLDFTDQTMVYASYSRGYKGGGANPPLPSRTNLALLRLVTHPETFDPEFVNAYEIGTKNALLDGSLTINGDAFYYDYTGYQISQIVDRTALNMNFDAKVEGAEIEATWEPVPGLRLNFSGGVLDSSVDKGQSAIDLIDRTAGHSDWLVIKPDITDTSNCILPASVVRQLIPQVIPTHTCEIAYNDAGITLQDYTGVPFDASTAPNDGAGFSKDLSGNKLPNAPPFTLSFGAQYSMPLSADWAGTFRSDFYWQGNSFARIYNDKPYDQLHGYTNLNFALIFTNQDGWQAMAYVKNVLDRTAITGAFLNSDDTALTTNVFLTDPRLFGIRITKNW